MLRLIPGAGHMVHHAALPDVMAAIDAAANAPLLQIADRENPRVAERSTLSLKEAGAN
jgi:hypothetical protein